MKKPVEGKLSSKPAPFIIWTLQRTGGTNLAKKLFELSDFKGTQHEPFNPGRIYGHITECWKTEQDVSALNTEVEVICAQGVLIKHCVEVVPWEVTEALVRASCKAGYRHLFLYRRNALDRLLSLHFAKKTGVWGANNASLKELTGANEIDANLTPVSVNAVDLSEHLPVEKLVQHEKHCVQTLTRTLDLLLSLGEQPQAVAYEDVYQTTNLEQPERVLYPVLAYLGLGENETVNQSWLAEVVGKGDQGTRGKYREFLGVSELEKRIKSVMPFNIATEVKPLMVQIYANLPPWVLRCFIDVSPAQVTNGQVFELGGVVVLNKDAPVGLKLQLVDGVRVIDVQWDLPSQRMALEFPNCANSGHARFIVKDLLFREDTESFTLVLAGENGQHVSIAEIATHDYSRIHIEPLDRLIYDVGANDGADTWFYLRKGFRVVAVEAIPELVKSLCETFSTQIRSGRLVVERVAIADQPGELTFTVNDERTEWSSGHGAFKASAGASRQITVPATTLTRLFERYGVPFYVKIDIEGGELSAVTSLQSIGDNAQPQLVSFELNEEWEKVLECVFSLGYRRFQLVRQDAPYLPFPPVPSQEGLDYRCAISSNMSGPFGKDLPKGRWVGMVEIIKQVLQSHEDMRSRNLRGKNPGWYDVHAARPDFFSGDHNEFPKD